MTRARGACYAPCMADTNTKTITRFVDTKTQTVLPTIWADGIPPRQGDRTHVELSNGERWAVECGPAVISWGRDPVTNERVQHFNVWVRRLGRVVDAQADSIDGEGC